MSFVYEGYEIVPAVAQIADSCEWTIEFLIERREDRGRAVKKFATSETCRSREDAIARSAELGRRIVDRAVPGCTVEDLTLDP